jgi:hypothetical protein
MAPSPIPAPLPPWAKALLQVAPFISTFLQDALEYIGELAPSSDDGPDEWRHVQLVFRDAGNLDSADRLVTSLDLVNITGGLVDSSWTDGDYTAVNGAIGTLLLAWATQAQTRLAHVETRYYRRAFNPMSMSQPFAVSGPPEKVFPPQFASGGSGAGVQANQVAMTSTEITAYPRHWGRSYWPLLGSTRLDATGRIITATCDSFAMALHDCYQALMAAEFFPVVPITQVQKLPTRGLLTVNEVQVDNIPDVIRRRRIHTTTYRKRLPLAAELRPVP